MRDNGTEIPLTLVRLAASVESGQGGVDAFFRSTQAALPALGKTVELRLSLPAVDDAVALSPNALYGANLVYRIVDGSLQAQTVERLGQIQDDQLGLQMLVVGDVFEDGDLVLNSRLPQAIHGLEVDVKKEAE